MTSRTIPRGTLEIARTLLSAAIADGRRTLIKGAAVATQRRRAKAIAAVLEPMADEVAAYFEGMAGRMRIRKALAKIGDADSVLDWGDEEKRLREVIGRWYLPLGEEAYASASDELAVNVPWDVSEPGVKSVLATLGRQVTAVTDTSRAKVQAMVTAAIDRGYSTDQLMRGVADDGFGGLKGLVGSWASTPTGRAGSRAALIAVTESATAYNSAALGAYADSGVVKLVHVFDGEGCGWRRHDDDDKANGSQRTLDEATEHPIAHPRCQRAFGPLTEAAA